MLVLWTISFGFPFPDNCDRETLRDLLHRCAQDWPGWEKFPWRVTRGIHRFIDDPPVNFHYLLLQNCILALACDVVLRVKQVNLDDILDLLIRERFEFVGGLRHLLINSLQVLRDSEGKSHIPDCTSIEEGHLGVSPDELERRRKVFRTAVERAAREFVRVLTYTSQVQNMDGSVGGHTMKAWARGVELPTQKELSVRIEQVDGQTVISPRPEEVCEFVRAGKTIPKLVVRGLRAQSMAHLVEERKPEGCGQRPAVAGQGAQASAKIIGDYNVILIGKRTIKLAGKNKARAFLRFVHLRLKTEKRDDFYVDEQHEAFNATIPESKKKRRWLSDRFREDLFKGMEKEFDLLFETLDKAAGHYRLRF